MPIFDYKCKACDHVFEHMEKMNAEPLIDCPECGKPELKKQIGASEFRFRGSGFYCTSNDYKRRRVAERS